jgi:hypothetical protein
MLIMAAMGWLLTEAWMRIGDGTAGHRQPLHPADHPVRPQLQRRAQPVAAGVLAAVAVSIVPLAVFAIERLAGWWPLDDAQATITSTTPTCRAAGWRWKPQPWWPAC